MPAFSPKAPLEKLSLAIRKEIRDEWESKKSDLESQIEVLLGYSLSFKFDVNAVWAYAASSGATSPRNVFYGYADGFVQAVGSYVEKYGDTGSNYFKKAVTKGEVTLEVNELGTNAPTISADVKDGSFRILFKEDLLGYNQGYLLDALTAAINEARHEGFCLIAMHSIKTDYETEIKSLHDEVADILALPDLVLDPNFEANYAGLLKKADKDWQRNFGAVTLEYFKGIKDQLLRQGFKNDDMLQEGFAEGVPKKTITLRIVDKTNSGSINESVLEDGTLYIQTTPDYWYYNVYDAGASILNIL